MLYSGPAFSATALGDGIVELKFDLAGESVNKLNQTALKDLDAATQAIAKAPDVKGVVLTSGKPVFIYDPHDKYADEELLNNLVIKIKSLEQIDEILRYIL